MNGSVNQAWRKKIVNQLYELASSFMERRRGGTSFESELTENIYGVGFFVTRSQPVDATTPTRGRVRDVLRRVLG